jgi:tetratricopeptide (TPR) repeat protein
MPMTQPDGWLEADSRVLRPQYQIGGNIMSLIVENQVLAKKHKRLSYRYLVKNQDKKALEECDKAIELAPDWSEAHNMRGIILEEMGKLDESILEYRKAVRLDPGNQDAGENLASAEKSAILATQVRANRAGNIGRKRSMRRLLWLLPVVIVLLAVTFPHWNPQKLYIRSLIRDLGVESKHEKAFKVLTQDMGERAVEPLIEALNDKHPQIQARAKDALVAIGTPAIGPLIAHYGTGEVLIQMGAPVVMPLIAKIEEENTYPSGWFGVLYEIGMPAVEPLIAAAREGSTGFRSDTIRILFGDRDWRWEGWEYRDCGILASTPPTGDTRTRAIELLVSMVGDADPSIRGEALAVLPNLPWVADQRVSLLITALRDEDSSVRLEAVDALDWMYDERAVPALVESMTAADPVFRAEAAATLVNTDAGVNALVAMFNAEELANTYRDYEVITQARDVASVPILIAVMFSYDDLTLSEFYLDQGGIYLDRAVVHWASMHGYEINYYLTTK